jgi:hypothetical protein
MPATQLIGLEKSRMSWFGRVLWRPIMHPLTAPSTSPPSMMCCCLSFHPAVSRATTSGIPTVGNVTAVRAADSCCE